MSDERPTDVLGSLPHTRPHRRSDKRASRPGISTPLTETRAVTQPEPAAEPQALAAKPRRTAAPKAKPAAEPRATPQAKTRTTPAARREPLGQPPQPAGAPSSRPRKPAAAARAVKPASAGSGKPAAQRKSAGSQRSDAQPGSRPGGTDLLGTAVQAAAELAEIGLSVGARAVRRAVSRLPRP